MRAKKRVPTNYGTTPLKTTWLVIFSDLGQLFADRGRSFADHSWVVADRVKNMQELIPQRHDTVLLS